MEPSMEQMMKHLRANPAMLRTLMESQDGQNLMRMMTQASTDGIQKAAQAAARGDPSQLAMLVRKIMESPDGADLVERISRNIQC